MTGNHYESSPYKVAKRLHKPHQKIGAVLVLGAGIAGIQASLDLAESGYYVYLVEQSPAIGGTMPMLDKTFPTNDCSICILSPKLVECGRHPNIKIYTNSDLIDVRGKQGNFTARIVRHPRYVDPDKCENCGRCAEVCPLLVPNEFNQAINNRHAIYKLYPQAFPNAYCIDGLNCKGCGACEKICRAKAINRAIKEETFECKVGAVILCPGFEKIDPRPLFSYGYGRFPNVLTSLELERILSAGGPFQGNLVRLYDHREPKRMAWIQCVGSRNAHEGRGYCSSVCCMYAIKQTIIAKEHSKTDLDTTIFFMDIRSYDKGMETYYSRAKYEYGVRFIRSRISEVVESVDDQKNLIIRYLDQNGSINSEIFDLVILSVGFQISAKDIALGKKLGLNLNHYGFCEPLSLSGVKTSKPGIYVAGGFGGPKNISETVIQASAAACAAGRALSEVRKTLIREKEYPEEHDVSEQDARIGVFVCHCGINIGKVIRVPEVVESAKILPKVVHTEEFLHACSQDSQAAIKKAIAKYSLNRIVVASCSPHTHKQLFQETLKEAGINQYLLEMVNIRDQCSWVHAEEPGKATQKAKDLVAMHVAKVSFQKPMKKISIGLMKSTLVIGGGVSGMTSALSLASEEGYPVHLVEKTDSLGGLAKRIYQGFRGEDVQIFLKELINKVYDNPLITTYLSSEIVKTEGYPGNFVTTLFDGREIKHGIVIISTGGQEYKPVEYLFGQSDRVMTYLELEEAITKNDSRVRESKNIVLINCVGSREKERPYCSRICCHKAIKLVLKIKHHQPKANIFVFYRDIRTYGFMEDLYREARLKGVIFIHYHDEQKPLVEKTDNGLLVTFIDHVLKQPIVLNADLIGLAAAVLPATDNAKLSRLFRAPLTENGFFLEAHMKLRPVDSISRGIFLAGLAHSPKNLEENLTQAKAAACRAASILNKNELESEGMIAVVQKERCAACLTCVRLCIFNAPRIINNKAHIEPTACQGCGACVEECPHQAIILQGSNDFLYRKMTNSLFTGIRSNQEEPFEPKIIGFCCDY